MAQDDPKPSLPEEELRRFYESTAKAAGTTNRRQVLGAMLGVLSSACGGEGVGMGSAGSGGSLGAGGTGPGTGGLPGSGGQASGRAPPTGGEPGAGGDTASGGSEAGTGGEPAKMGRSAYDLIELGSTGIVTSRLAMGSGTNGVDGSSVQTRMGSSFTDLLVRGYDRGIRFFETADAYGAHGHVGAALQQVGRQNVTLLTKTMAQTRQEAEADLARFFEELGTDYIDVLLLHIRTSASWTSESAGAMEVLAEAKAQGKIRAHGVSCHSLAALRLARQTDWVDIDLARINPFGLHMDSDPQTVITELEAMKQSGKGVLGMKILAQGDSVNRFDESIEHATRLDCIHGFTIGFTSLAQLDQVAAKIASV